MQISSLLNFPNLLILITSEPFSPQSRDFTAPKQSDPSDSNGHATRLIRRNIMQMSL